MTALTRRNGRSLRYQEKIVQAGKEAVRKTKNLGRQQGLKQETVHKSTCPSSNARVYESRVKASKTVLHIVRLLLSHDLRLMLPSHGNLLFDDGICYAHVTASCQIGHKQEQPHDAASVLTTCNTPFAGQQEWAQGGEGRWKGQAEPCAQSRLTRGNEVEGHVPNSIKTAKYNAITFFPIFLMEMFGACGLSLLPGPGTHSCLRSAHSAMSIFCDVT